MRVFVAGASGAIGRPLVRQLLAAGHGVTGMTRREEAAGELRADGAEAVVCDAFDPAGLNAALAAARPEVVLDQLTALPDRFDFKDPDLYTATNRVRTEGTRNLVAAAGPACATRLVSQSIAFLYAPEGGWVRDEGAPVVRGGPPPFGDGFKATLEHERMVLEAEGMDGLILRYGFFYGPNGTYTTEGYWAEEFRKRRFPIVGGGEGHTSFIQIEDAASATVAAVERGKAGIYNIVDDDPAPGREWIPAYAEAVGAKRPFRVPKWIARLVAGKAIADVATSTRGASNEKAKRELGWQPRYPSWRQGFREALG